MKKGLKVALVLLVIILIIGMSSAGYYLLYGMRVIMDMDISVVDLETVEDGTYFGDFEEGFRWANTVSISIYNHKIIGINIVHDQMFKFKDVSYELFERVINKQANLVDIVSGATISSKAYLKAIENALIR
jgi:uncharacterized protein with FMN-binding domain